MKLTQRNLWKMICLMVITFGIYMIYWLVATKCELNKRGAEIPSAWLLIIPIVQIYFLYKFTEGYCAVVFKNQSQTIAHFLVITLLLPIGELILQSNINKMIAIIREVLPNLLTN